VQRLFGEGLRRRQSAGGVESIRRTRLPSSMSKARESMFRTFFARVQALSAQWGNHTFHARWTLEHGEPEALAFLEQLAVAEVTPWRCPCGCASIDADAACGSGQPQAPYRRLHIVKRWHERRLPAILTVPCGSATVGRIRRLAARIGQSTQRLESTTIERQQRINMVVYERQDFTLLYRRKY